jgi:hypothetical protein
MWIYVLFIGDSTPPDRLASPAFATAAESRCAATRQQLHDQGLVNVKATSPVQRGDLVERSDALLAGMVAQLRAMTPSGEDGRVVSLWLDDWDQWLRDRQTWAAQLNTGKDGPFLEHARDNGEPRSKLLDTFAQVNGMSSCTTPDNV